ncbi:flagellar hook protein FlgE [Gluconobacter kanchanaburiensis]|uniref:Flagellar hook protein FlgE n=1 Tax=Gluconobacter kanchanaburiensis NBRC 103587 TaxID=1307948 RepID=A0A511B5B2_9PROT|nr:flagellar hook protein FlgE [Gluconobacter kanchanaburiensis]GEK95554.1 flagellar hook protein FlgE [Gluconobacter kanchanaburiensis NBRC 103587]
MMLGHTTRSLFHVREYAMSSIINAVQTAVSGLNAQSHAFTDLSNNIANSQTTGYKASTTSFEDYVTNNDLASDGEALSDSVVATTRQHNDNQGMVTTSTNSTALAISGNGFFNVVQATGQSNDSTPVLGSQQYYTRNGDFSQDKNGYLVNTSGYYLEGYNVNASTGSLGTSLSPIQVPSTIKFQPTESTKLTMTGQIGSSATSSGGSSTTSATAYDSKGNAQTVSLNWTQVNATTWTVSNASDPTNSATVTFDASTGALASVNGQSQSSGSAATFEYEGSPQNMTVSLGTIGNTSGVSIVTDGSTPTGVTTVSDSVTSGTFSGISMQTDGSVMATFDNGYSQLVAKVPLTTFADPNSLSPENGQAYTATSQSGSPQIKTVDTNGAGTLTTGSIEESTSDLTGDLSKLIVAQQAYGANTKVVSTADQLLQTTLAMIQ